MTEIIPAIIAKDFKEIKQKIALVDNLVDWVQIDVSDGLFASSFTWENAENLFELDGKAKVEVHLMVEQPEHYVADWAKVADRVIVHLESTEHLPEIIKQFEHQPVKLGIALLLETPLEQLGPYASQVDLIQLMSIKNIGRHGESFAQEVIERVRDLRLQLPNVTISVDGGITPESAEALIAAGANNLVIGSAIWDSKNIPATISEFKKL